MKTLTKTSCTQATLCTRAHQECDCCGRQVHGLRVVGDRDVMTWGLCYLCVNHGPEITDGCQYRKEVAHP